MNAATTDPKDLATRVAQLLVVRLGSNLPPAKTVSDDESRVAEILRRTPIGGLLVFNAEWPALRETLDRLQALAPTPLVVCADLERGAGQQVRGLVRFPHAAAFARLGDAAPEAVASLADLTARQAMAAGVHVNLSPVADVNSNRMNPIISTRAFGETPEGAASLVEAFVRGSQQAGGFCTAKHFPGHGDTQNDSHDSLPVVERDADQLDAVELPPFLAAARAGAPLVMTAHVAYPSLDPSGDPATVSAPILRGLLRERLGYEGVVCSDSLLMAGVRDRFDNEGDAAVAAIAAGVDLLLDVDDPAVVVEGVVRAVEEGRLDRRLVDEAYGRVETLRQQCAHAAERAADDAGEWAPAAEALATRVAHEAVHVLHAPGGASRPAFTSQRPCVVLMRGIALPIDPPEQPLAAAMRDRFGDVDYHELNAASDASAYRSAAEAVAAADDVLVAMIVKPAAWQRFGLNDQQAALLREALESSPGAVVASLGSPLPLEQHVVEPGAGAWAICTYSDEGVSQAALAAAIDRQR